MKRCTKFLFALGAAICVIVVGVFVFSSNKKTSRPVSLPRLGKCKSCGGDRDMPLTGPQRPGL
ncbi:hypothetical protein [Candidatus Coxiella mudrowiae]|uniref:hypothetical protein n=1 Tax=Candidatus Coxiella mudrowiae TaxID=2054173 RepID=UPI000C28BF4A|nr:hypothetical protein [Candidatus Coxiella mudrowiae]